MRIELGDKIKELRKRDGRKQEDLAVALGVTNQAVSRWEANGGYPDMELLPAIANYFHVTIDELFGYDNDRQTKLQSYIDQADQMRDTIIERKDAKQRVAFLRNAIAEFPSEWQLQERLAGSLMKLGFDNWRHHRMMTGEDGIRYDTEDNQHNECWREAVSLYEEVLKKEIHDDSRREIIHSLMQLYNIMGEQEKAEKLAFTQSPVSQSREVLLAETIRNDKTEMYRADAILNLLHHLYWVTRNAVAANDSLSHSQKGLDTLLAFVRLYESIFEDGNYGIYHNDMCMLNLDCSFIAMVLDDAGRAQEYFETALEHYLLFRQVKGKIEYAAPLIHKAENYAPSIVLMDRKDFEREMEKFPAEYADAIRNNPRYAEIFA